MNDDPRIERARTQADRLAANLSARAWSPSAQKYVGTVFNGGSMPTANPAWYLTYPTQCTGGESEGGAGTTTVLTSTSVPVLVLGTVAPVVGDVLLARMIAGKWVAECCAGGGGGGCTCATTIYVESCVGTAIAGATVTVGSLPPFTTDGSGHVEDICIDSLGGASTQQVTAAAPGYLSSSVPLSLTCGGTETIQLLPTGSPSITFVVNGCCLQPLPNATLVIAGASYTTNSGGQVVLGLTPAGAYPWSASKARFATQSGSVTIGVCGAGGNTLVTVDMTPAPGYYCAPGNTSGSLPELLADPVPAVLNLTDSVWGSTTVTYSAVPTPGWYGSITIDAPGDCGCPPRPGVVIAYALTQCPGAFSSGIGIYGYNTGLGVIPCPANPAGATSSTGMPTFGYTYTYSLSPTIPFDWSVIYPVAPCNPGNGTGFVDVLYLYPSGGTITVTE